MAKAPSIVVVNAHWNNRGDEAAHCALWEKIQQRYPSCKLQYYLKRSPREVTWFPAHIAASYRSSQFESK